MQDLDKPFRDMKEGEGKGFYPLQMSREARLMDSLTNMTA